MTRFGGGHRGVRDVLMLVCDGLTGLPDAVNTVWPDTIVQTCAVHLLRNSFRYAARQYWAKIARALKPVYTAPTEDAALERFMEFAEAWGKKYPAIVRLWESSWAEFVPFLQFDVEIRKIVALAASTLHRRTYDRWMSGDNTPRGAAAEIVCRMFELPRTRRNPPRVQRLWKLAQPSGFGALGRTAQPVAHTWL